MSHCPESQPHHPFSVIHLVWMWEAPTLNQGVTSREGRVRAQGGTSVSRSMSPSSNWPVPHDESHDPTSHSDVGLGKARLGLSRDPGCWLGEPFPSRRPAPSCAELQLVGCPGCQRWHQDRQTPGEGPVPRPSRPPQPVTATTTLSLTCISPALHPSPGDSPTRKWFSRPSWKQCCLSTGAADHIHRCRLSLPVCTCCCPVCLSMLGSTRVTMIVKRKEKEKEKKKDACILKCL